jgi:hypothetical protein
MIRLYFTTTTNNEGAKETALRKDDKSEQNYRVKLYYSKEKLKQRTHGQRFVLSLYSISMGNFESLGLCEIKFGVFLSIKRRLCLCLNFVIYISYRITVKMFLKDIHALRKNKRNKPV